MKALSLWQPWATLVAIGAKRIETRSWETLYRGPLVIHATQAFPREARELCATEPFYSVLSSWFTWFEEPENDFKPELLPRGCALAVVDLTRCRLSDGDDWNLEFPAKEQAFGDFTAGRFCWYLTKRRRFRDPIPCRGGQGLWNFPDHLLPEGFR